MEQANYKALYEDLKPAYDQLKHELEQLKKFVFGSKHERFVPATAPEQLSLGLQPEESIPAPAVIQQITYNRKQAEEKKNVPHRMPLPAHLPRETVVIEPAESVEGCVKIGEEVTEELEYAPGKLFVRRYVRPKYARKQGEGIAVASLPPRPIEKGIAGPRLLAQVIIDKFLDHLPVYRQIQRFEREGVKLPASTIADWISTTCTLIEPLGVLLRSKTLASGYIQADETTIPVLDKDKKGSTHRGYYWVYNDPINKRVLFDYREGRGREGPFECLKDFMKPMRTLRPGPALRYCIVWHMPEGSLMKPFLVTGKEQSVYLPLCKSFMLQNVKQRNCNYRHRILFYCDKRKLSLF